MASAGDEDGVVLSDVEADDQVREVLAENSKSELQESFNRLKIIAHEAIKKRDEALREKEDALISNEKLSTELAIALKERDESAKAIETGAQMLVTGIEMISRKVSNFKNFTSGGLPRSHKYTGLSAVAYGVIKRTNEIVEELVRQIESIAKSRNEARVQMEQRNYEIAIEVSQLEATINGLREEVSKKTCFIDNLEKSVAEKDGKISEVEKQVLGLRQMVSDYDHKLRNLELKMDSQRPLLVDHLNYVSKIHDRLYDVVKIVDVPNKMDQSHLSGSMFLPKETGLEENIRASLAGMESMYKLTRIVVEKTKGLVEERSREVKSLSETASRLVKEKEHIGSRLRLALSRRMTTGLSSKTNELFKVAENGFREAGIDFKFCNHLGDGKDEIYDLAGALDNIIKQSQLEIIELQHSVEELRAETSLLKEHVEAQTKELNNRKQHVEELKEKERVSNENVEGLMMDIAAAEEEITRWKVAAQQEAAAGKAVEQEFVAQVCRHKWTFLLRYLSSGSSVVSPTPGARGGKTSCVGVRAKAQIQRRNSSCCHGSKRRG
ncbi:kinectin-like isoform X2 [Camellia sinensis]|uniref:kinectin-like isoform X2 n=1 Tax=Camellia sinensis TaxID=4442 RepID=UPI001036D2D3|nr:kinectin-like isoform X2 [Camellia sinensis]